MKKLNIIRLDEPHPADLARKPGRPCLVLGQSGTKWLLAPLSSHYQRAGNVPAGACLVRADSPARGASDGVKGDAVVSIRDARMVDLAASPMQVGSLALERDQRLLAQLAGLAREFAHVISRESAKMTTA